MCNQADYCFWVWLIFSGEAWQPLLSLAAARFEGNYFKMYSMLPEPYFINKNINKPIEFKGLKAQYVLWLGIVLLLLFVIFLLLYFMGISSYICLVVVAVLGAVAVGFVQRVSKRYGEHGLMKTFARRRVPRVVKSRSRKVFIELKQSSLN